MKVLLVSNYKNDGQESMQKFASFMASGLAESGHEVRVVRPAGLVGRLHASGEGVGKWLGYVDKFGVFPAVLKLAIGWSDVVHICDHSNSVYTKHLQGKPHVVSCHDLIAVRSAMGEVAQNQTRWTGRQLQRMIVRGLVGAQHVACVSEATKRDLLRVTQIPEQRVSRVYNSLNYPYSRMKEHEARERIGKLQINPGTTFFLHVGGNQWYKNRLGVLRIFSRIRGMLPQQNPKMIMVGKPWTAEMRDFVKESGIGNATLELPGIDNEDLRAFYSTATMLLFPSLEEGFGWPIIEAQSCGCPVVTSGRAPMDEVGGTAAVYVDPGKPEEAATAAVRALEKPDEWREASLRNAARFSSTAMISGYVSLYEKVCAGRAAGSWLN
ncbi:MAG TPA: glycosyltransferase family 1 protein [Candidatus Acidoferrum sp.]|jgi:glycosyltransferase involved in cell wall biosynthesis